MTRKRFEKLMIAKHKSQARDIRQSVRAIIDLRHYSEGKSGTLMVYDKKTSASRKPSCTRMVKCLLG